MRDARRGQARHVTAGFGRVEIDWASPQQEEAFLHPPTPLCLSGGFGSAKTWAACLKLLYLADVFPKSRWLIARRVWEELKHTTMATFFKICRPEMYDAGGRRSDSEKYLRLNNGSEFLWMHMDDPETENVIAGLEINGFFLDQAEELEEAIFDKLTTRVGRWDQAEVPDWMVAGHEEWPWRNPVTGAPQVPPCMLIACNPEDFYHWIYKRFHPDSREYREKTIPQLNWRTAQPERDERGEPLFVSWEDLGYRMIRMRSYDNKYLPEHNLRLMMQRDEGWRRRFVEGEWGITEGTIHVVDPLSLIETDARYPNAVDPNELLAWIANNCTLHRALDHGDSSPTACLWFAVDREGNVLAYREYYQPNRLISYHRKAIADMSAGEKYVFNLADPSIFHKVTRAQGGKWSVADEYSDPRTGADTMLHWQKGDNNELGTRNRIGEYLAVDPDRIHPVAKKRGAPRLFFVLASEAYPNGIRHGLNELRSARRKQVGTHNGKPVFSEERDDRIPDHAYDCGRYFIASRPPVAAVPGKVPPPDSFEAVRQRHLERNAAPRKGYLARKLTERRCG